jgi:hypothetical protein
LLNASVMSAAPPLFIYYDIFCVKNDSKRCCDHKLD